MTPKGLVADYRADRRIPFVPGRFLMLTIRKFLRTLIGVATPAQVLLACVLGALLGFLPVTNGGTVMAVLLAVLLLVLNANLFLAGIVAAGTKILSIVTAPLAFGLGRILIDGPTRPLAEMLANGPVTAWLGFDSYLAVGGLTLGLFVGIGLGLVTAILLRRLRVAPVRRVELHHMLRRRVHATCGLRLRYLGPRRLPCLDDGNVIIVAHIVQARREPPHTLLYFL